MWAGRDSLDRTVTDGQGGLCCQFTLYAFSVCPVLDVCFLYLVMACL